MVSSARHVITCVLLISSTALYAYSQTTPEAKDSTASISGKVTIKDKGAVGIVIGLLRVNSPNEKVRSYKAISDDQGNYKIINISPGHYQVVVATPLFVPDEAGRGKTILISKDETIENLDLPLVRGGVITGKVSDVEGRPAIEEEVSLYPLEGKWFYLTPRGVFTDDRGIYRIFGIPPGKYRVAAGPRNNFTRRGRGGLYSETFHPAAADAAQASIIEVTEGSEATNVDITFSRAVVRYSARGRIVDGRTGRPVPNVTYGLKTILENGFQSTTTGEVSNSQGEFKLENLVPGKYAVFVRPAPDVAWRADEARFEVIDHDITGLILKTTTGATLSGVMVLEGTADKALQASLSQIQLHAYFLDESLSDDNQYSSVIEQNGSFRIHALKAGTLAFTLSNHGRLQMVRVERDGIVYSKGLPIKEGEQISGVRVVLNYGSGTLQGVFKIEGGTLPPNAIRSVSVRRLGEDPNSFISYPNAAPVDARGQFIIEGLIPGTYEVNGVIYIVGTRRPFRATKQQVVITEGSATTITLTVNLESSPDRP